MLFICVVDYTLAVSRIIQHTEGGLLPLVNFFKWHICKKCLQVKHTSKPLDKTIAVCSSGIQLTGSSPTGKPESAARASHIEAPWLRVMASYKTEDAVNICRLSVGSNLKPNVPCCVSLLPLDRNMTAANTMGQ